MNSAERGEMRVTLIAAMLESNRGIGWKGGLPWFLGDDLAQFHRLTQGHFLVFGRTTFEGLRTPLKGRRLLVLSRDQTYRPAGVQVVHSLLEAVRLACEAGEDELFIGGGEQVYRGALPIATHMHLSLVCGEAAVDAFFPSYSQADWRTLETEFYERSPRNQFPFRTLYLERKRPPSCP